MKNLLNKKYVLFSLQAGANISYNSSHCNFLTNGLSISLHRHFRERESSVCGSLFVLELQFRCHPVYLFKKTVHGILHSYKSTESITRLS